MWLKPSAEMTDRIAALERKLAEAKDEIRERDKRIRTLEKEARRTFERTAAQMRARVARMAASARPIIVGPFYGEVGFELLYWAPFVRWAVLEHGIDPGRLVIASRGGSRQFYGLDDAPYVDLFAQLKPHKLRNLKAGVQKQETVRLIDRRFARAIAADHGRRRPHLLHPWLMYAAFTPVWEHTAAPEQLLPYLVPHRVTPPRLPDLPPEYVAVRFYASRAFPTTPANAAFVQALVDRLAARTPVVVLRSSIRFDDHDHFETTPGPAVTIIDVGETPAESLAIQASVAGHARLCIGTIGGGSYMPPFAGVPSLGVWSRETFRRHHNSLAAALFEKLGGGRFSVVSAHEVGGLLGIATPDGAEVGGSR